MFRGLETTRKERAMSAVTSDTVAATRLDRVDQIGRRPRTMAFIMVGERRALGPIPCCSLVSLSLVLEIYNECRCVLAGIPTKGRSSHSSLLCNLDEPLAPC